MSTSRSARTNEVGGLLTFGETMGLFTADGIGTLGYARHARIGIGGAESNVAVGVARLGQPVTWVGRVGRDAVGELIIERLRVAGVDTRAIPDDAFTGLMVRHCRAGTAVHVDYHRAGSAGSRLTPEDVTAELISAAAIVHVTGITPALSSGARETVACAIELANAADIPVSLDINYRSKLWSPADARAALLPLLQRAAIVFAGVDEAQLMLDTTCADPLALAHRLADLGVDEAVIKDGARGATAVIEGGEHRVPALAVTVVDPVGAGDAFVAGYLAEHLVGHDAAQRLRTAVAMGAYAVTVPGDCDLLPTRDELVSASMTSDVHR